MRNTLTVFEHEALRLGEGTITTAQLEALQKFHGSRECPYFSLIHRGVKFKEHVGILQVGRTTIEVLPKADKHSSNQDAWRDLLIHMLQEAGVIPANTLTSTGQRLQNASLLDIFLLKFLEEVESLLRAGLVKRYRVEERNRFALKGKLLVSKHLSQNALHAERFFTAAGEYQRVHPVHQLLYAALCRLPSLTQNPNLTDRIGRLLLDFPEQPKLNNYEHVFTRLPEGRKWAPYASALVLAKLILLNLSPNLKTGQNEVLALMFDMNYLWEAYVGKVLRRYLSEWKVELQKKKLFWKNYTQQPDILLTSNQTRIIIDTKWKRIDNERISMNDLRQMYAYKLQWHAERSILLYPKSESNQISIKGDFTKSNHISRLLSLHACFVEVSTDNQKLRENILQTIQSALLADINQ